MIKFTYICVPTYRANPAQGDNMLSIMNVFVLRLLIQISGTKHEVGWIRANMAFPSFCISCRNTETVVVRILTHNIVSILTGFIMCVHIYIFKMFVVSVSIPVSNAISSFVYNRFHHSFF